MAQSGNFDAALSEYEDLYGKYLDPRLWYNIARLLHKQGRPAESIQYYRRFIDSGVESNAQRLEKTRSFLEQAQAEALQASANQRQLDEQRQQEQARDRSERARAPKVPLYKRWWLWATVGGVVAIGAIGLALGLGSMQPSYPGTPELRPFP